MRNARNIKRHIELIVKLRKTIANSSSKSFRKALARHEAMLVSMFLGEVI